MGSVSDRRRRLTAGLVLVGYAFVASGVPLPNGGVSLPPGDAVSAGRLAGKDRSRPFPCMDRPCGCATAEQCLTRCCCHTPAETLAWARSRRLDARVIAGLERRVAAASKPAAKPGGCCAATSTPSCCADERHDDVPTESTSHHGEQAPPSPGGGSRTVILRAMLACGGIVAGWLACGGALPPPPVALVVVHEPVVGPVTVGDERCRGRHLLPEPPPPRG